MKYFSVKGRSRERERERERERGREREIESNAYIYDTLSVRSVMLVYNIMISWSIILSENGQNISIDL